MDKQEKVKAKYVVMIQARMGSSRLPNKVLKDICGKPDLQWVVERLQRSHHADEVMVVTSIEKSNLPLIRLCTELGIRVFVGAEGDVLDRYYQAAKLICPEYVIRITADCPLFDWRYLDQAIESMDEDMDYLHIKPDTYPDGLDFEIMKFAVLKKSWKEARLSSEREHVTMYIKSHPEMFKIQEFIFPIANCENYRWTLDEDEDYKVIQKIYGHFLGSVAEDGNKKFSDTEAFVTEDILDFVKRNPEIALINSSIGRNEGLAKSMANDRVLNDGEII